MTIELTNEQRTELYGYAWNLLGDGMGSEWDDNPEHTRGVIELLNEVLGGDYDDKERLYGRLQEFGRKQQLERIASELLTRWDEVRSPMPVGQAWRMTDLIHELIKLARGES